MASKQASKRLTKEYLSIAKQPPPFIVAKPLESNILEWHYVITGPENTPYHGGEYWGVVLFPSEYPFKPPGIKMYTPNGRFQPNVRLCLSMSDYHPGSWNPSWSVSTILTGLLSFMLEDHATTGSISSTIDEKRVLNRKSRAWNRSQYKFRDVFPDLATASESESSTSPTSASASLEAAAIVSSSALSSGSRKRPAASPGTQPNHLAQPTQLPLRHQRQQPSSFIDILFNHIWKVLLTVVLVYVVGLQVWVSSTSP